MAYIGAEFWDGVKHTSFVIAVRVESEGPMQELHPGDQTWYISEDGITLEQLPFIDPRTGAPAPRRTSSPPRAAFLPAPQRSAGQNMPRTGHRARSPLGKVQRGVPDGHQHERDPEFPEVSVPVYLPQPELDLEALQG